MDSVPGWAVALLVAAEIGTLSWLELRRPLRLATREPKSRRFKRNLALAAVSLAIVAPFQALWLAPLSEHVTHTPTGLLGALDLDPLLEAALAFVLLDYTLWWWHFLNHRVPFLWRFHLVHHVDLELDASTALRFHFGELWLSIGWRAGQIAAIGTTTGALALWQSVLIVSILFHHSNVALPHRVERWLVKLVVTPRMHGIHHSTVRDETNSNWSSIFTLWDYVHRTARLDVPQRDVRIGVPAWRAADELTWPRLLLLPFRKQRGDFEGDAGTRVQPTDATSRHELAA